VSKYLAQNGLKHKSLGFDYQGVEMVQVMREDLMAVCAAIYTDGWNYLRNQCGYDSEPGGDLVSVYHLCKMDPETNDSTPPPEEVSLQRLQRLRAQPSKVSLLVGSTCCRCLSVLGSACTAAARDQSTLASL